ncbi:hypothetical protein ACWERW_15305 [Streptomyces sp. NPDC004012]
MRSRKRTTAAKRLGASVGPRRPVLPTAVLIHLRPIGVAQGTQHTITLTRLRAKSNDRLASGFSPLDIRESANPRVAHFRLDQRGQSGPARPLVFSVVGEQFVAGRAVVAVLEAAQRGQQWGVGEEVGRHFLGEFLDPRVVRVPVSGAPGELDQGDVPRIIGAVLDLGEAAVEALRHQGPHQDQGLSCCRHIVGGEAERGHPVQQPESTVGQQNPVAVGDPVPVPLPVSSPPGARWAPLLAVTHAARLHCPEV